MKPFEKHLAWHGRRDPRLSPTKRWQKPPSLKGEVRFADPYVKPERMIRRDRQGKKMLKAMKRELKNAQAKT